MDASSRDFDGAGRRRQQNDDLAAIFGVVVVGVVIVLGASVLGKVLKR